jgi:hypothetical protein
MQAGRSRSAFSRESCFAAFGSFAAGSPVAGFASAGFDSAAGTLRVNASRTAATTTSRDADDAKTMHVGR